LLLQTLEQLILPSADNKKLMFRVVIHPQVPRYVMADMLRLKQILLNLLSNAVKFTAHGHVALHVHYVPPFAEVPEGSDSNELMAAMPRPLVGVCTFLVEDTGIGLSAEQQNRIFDQFEQADRSTTRQFGGSGLGLSISRSLAQLMGGDLGVVSQSGKGSRFWVMMPMGLDPSRSQVVYLPETEPVALDDSQTALALEASYQSLCDKQPAGRFKELLDLPSASSPSLSQQQLFSRKPRILVVEDNAINQRVACRLLEKLGTVTLTANNGAEALMILSQARLDHEPVDLVLMDCQMPVMDGYEASRQIRRLEDSDAQVPIVALTGNVLSGEEDKCRSAGMNDYLSKPLQWQQLADKLIEQLPHLIHPNMVGTSLVSS
ncbi:MAG: ATP-binding protein, partial [Vampirovibrionales bacterium]